MASEQFSLCWDNFHKNMSAGMNTLLENEEMVDVTLAVEGKHIKAHKMVLSVCSPYFKELFKSSPCQHPIVFMKDVSYVAVSDLLTFMYQGEVQVSQENLTTFIKTAEALQIKGLTGDGNGSGDCELIDAEPEEKVTKIIEHKPGPKSKKHVQTISTSSSSVSPVPAAKRPRLSSQTETPPLTTTLTATKAEVITPTTSNNSNSTTTAEFVQFKMEPYEQTQSFTVPDDSGEDNFGDDAIDDSVDDTEDYTLMENTDEPQAGTSMDGAGEGQGKKKRTFRGRIYLNGYTYNTSYIRGNPPKRYLKCCYYRQLGCKARAVIFLNNTSKYVIFKSHNHPTDKNEKEIIEFLQAIKNVCALQHDTNLKHIYDQVAESYPEIAKLRPYTSIRTSMARWKSQTAEDEQYLLFE